MPYAIAVCEQPKTPFERWEITETIFDNGPEAGAYVKQENSFFKTIGSPVRFRVMQISEDDPLAWRTREQKKFQDGTYQRPPWHDAYGDQGLFEHIDPDTPTLIRFIASDMDGMRGRYTRMTPGRFILKYIDSHPNTDRLDQWCAQMGLNLETSQLKIARSAEEIVRVYTEGPHSCMSYKLNDPDRPCPFHVRTVHPVECYGDTEIGIAYIERRGEITARAMVWPDKKIYGRIYGDSARLTERLKEHGYVEDWQGFSGARIRVLTCQKTGREVAPYFDGDLGAIRDENEDMFIITDKPTIILKSPYGVARTHACESCGESRRVLHPQTDEDNEDEIRYVCEDCE